jgi:DNA polymerase III subunit delta
VARHCFEILLAPKLSSDLPPVVLVIGDDAFLRSETVHALLHASGLDPDQIRTFSGQEATWADIHDELASLSLFDTESKRAAVVTSGDELVKDHRAQVERWCESPAASSLLLLHLQTLPSNTRLYKIVEKGELGWIISCNVHAPAAGVKSPSTAEIKDWITRWGRSRHGIHLSRQQVEIILDAMGPEFGLLHQELAKLSLYADPSGKISDESVRSQVGSWSTRTTWDIADAVADGRIAFAMEQLQRVFATGEHPAAIVPQIAWSLRRYGLAAQLVLQSRRVGSPINADQAAGLSGFRPHEMKVAAQRLRRMGLDRASRILHWLLELDLKIKGSHSSPERAIFALEELCWRFN